MQLFLRRANQETVSSQCTTAQTSPVILGPTNSNFTKLHIQLFYYPQINYFLVLIQKNKNSEIQ